MRRLMKPLMLAAVVLVLAACGGQGSTNGAVPQNRSSSTPAMVAITIKIDMPATTTQAAKRRPAYLSPATQSITISVNGGTPVAQSLTPAGGNCSNPSFGATPVCTLVASAPIGSDTFTFVTYDGTNGTGNALSQNTVVQTIVAGQANTVAVTLEGVPVGVVVTPYPNQTNVEPSTTGYTLVGTTAANFLIVATDADGNVIIGPGTPALTVTSSSVNLTVAAVANNPNKFVLTPVTSGASVTLHVSAAGGSGGTATGAVIFALKAVPPTSLPKTLYSYVNSEIDIFAPGSVNTTPPSGKLTSALLTAVPNGLAWAPNGALDVLGSIDNGYLAVQYSAAQLAAGTGAPTPIIMSYQDGLNKNLLAEVGAIAVDSKGDVFVVGELLGASGFSVYEYKAGFTPTSSPTKIPSSPTGETAPTDVYIDQSDNLYVVNTPPNSNSTILEFAASNPSTAPTRTIGANAGFTTVAEVVAGGDGTLTVLDSVTFVMYVFAPGTTNNPSPEYVIQSPSDLFGGPIAVDASNNIYGNQFLAPGNQLDVYPGGAGGIPTALFTLQLTAANPLLTPVSLLLAR